MAYGANITEAIPVPIGNPVANQTYQATGVAYDIAVGGQPFFMETGENTPYRRVTAQYRKNQLDTTREPGEQTLTGWWLRSQSSFHLGQGIKFFEPAQDESLRFQYTYSKGCNIWEKGQVTLLNDVFSAQAVAYGLQPNLRPWQYLRSIQYGATNGGLLADKYTLKKVSAAGTTVDFQTNTATATNEIFALCDDGVYAYWITNTTGAIQIYKKLLTDNTGVAATAMLTVQPVLLVTNAVMEFTKGRIVAAINNKIYEIATTATALPSPVYTHPDNDVVFTSVTSSGAAIYLSAFSGIQSNIYKFTLSTTSGAMPTLTSAITAAELPVGETVFKIYYYLGFMAIGTSKGVRIASVSDTDGSINYGPLLFETTQPVYDVAGFDKYLWCTTNVDGNPGVTRINLAQNVSGLIFAYAWDLYDSALTGFNTVACAFAGKTQQLMFATDNNGTTNGKTYIQEPAKLVATALLRTGFVRYNTLENKLFKYITPRFNTTDGGLNILSVTAEGNEFTIGTFPQGSQLDSVGIAYPAGAQQYLGFEFAMTRSATDNTKGPLFTGYQLKVLPAIARQRLIQYPAMCYDFEMDKFNNPAGYEGSAYNRVIALETIESNGDTIKIEDFRTGESYTGIIEELDFTNKTPTDKRYSGYGGVLLITIRSIS